MQSYERIEGDHLYVFMSGEMRFDDRSEFWEYVKKFQAPEITTLVLDFSHVDFIDSAGMALLFNVYDQFADQDNKSIVLKNPKGHVDQIFGLVNIGTLFTIIKEEG